jgi:hypothetical protein
MAIRASLREEQRSGGTVRSQGSVPLSIDGVGAAADISATTDETRYHQVDKSDSLEKDH